MISLTINDISHHLDVAAEMPLLRDVFDLAGTRIFGLQIGAGMC